MKRLAAVLLVVSGSLSALTAGCSSSLAQPFEQMKSQPVTVHRLIDFEQPAAQPGAAVPGLPQIPPQIQQWLNGAAAALPPGLIPPGLLPGTAPPPADAAKFYNFKIAGTTQVTDNKTREEIIEIFGMESNFQNPRQSCMYAEFGFQIGQPMPGGTVQGAPNPNAPADILVSLSCEQVQMFNHAWPYGTKTGLTPDAVQKIQAAVRKAFGG